MDEISNEFIKWTPTDMLEIYLAEPDDFLKVKETLTRIGVASNRDQTLYQSCHILHKQGRYFILHFKELFMLDGKESSFTEDDLRRRNTIASLISDWGLADLAKPLSVDVKTTLKQIKVIPFNQKSEWSLISKYNIGNVKINK